MNEENIPFHEDYKANVAAIMNHITLLSAKHIANWARRS